MESGLRSHTTCSDLLKAESTFFVVSVKQFTLPKAFIPILLKDGCVVF